MEEKQEFRLPRKAIRMHLQGNARQEILAKAHRSRAGLSNGKNVSINTGFQIFTVIRGDRIRCQQNTHRVSEGDCPNEASLGQTES